MGNNNCLLSIVVPVYNASEFLVPCLDSLVNQDLPESDYEIICIDDGSTDDSLKILEDYSKNHTGIKIIAQENQGHAAARNTGMSEATGKYIWFVDSDDCIDEKCFGFIVNTMDENSIDMLSIRYVPFVNDNEIQTAPKQYIHPTKKTKTKIACSGIRIFSTELLRENNIVWNAELSPCDDIEFIFFARFNANNIVYNDSVSYYHRQRAGSVTKQTTPEYRKKFRRSFYLLANTYKRELSNPKYSEDQLKKIEDRKNQCTQAILMNLAMYENQETTDKYLDKLKSEGFYPYKKISYNLKPKISVKRTLMDWAQYLFPIEGYYKLFYKIIKK